MAMDQEIKAKWIAALESGEFKQGRGQLCDIHNNTYCCLGVLSVITNVPMNSYGIFIFPEGMSSSVSIPEDYCGISGDIRNRLAELNDGARWTFPQIANWIKENL